MGIFFHVVLRDEFTKGAKLGLVTAETRERLFEMSAAYYALFHLLIAESVNHWNIGRRRPRLARTFDHGPMKTVCSKPQADPRLQRVANAFVELQQARHSADYDYASVLTRVKALAYVESAKNAFRQWEEIKNQPFAQDFLLSLFAKERR